MMSGECGHCLTSPGTWRDPGKGGDNREGGWRTAAAGKRGGGRERKRAGVGAFREDMMKGERQKTRGRMRRKESDAGWKSVAGNSSKKKIMKR